MRWRLTSFLDEMENVAPVCILLHRKANNQTKVINGEKMHQQLQVHQLLEWCLKISSTIGKRHHC